MHIETLAVQRLRNVTEVELDLASGQNLLFGGNGQGKTTLLEGMYLLGALRSFRGARPGELMQQGCDDAVVRGVVAGETASSQVKVTLRRAGREVHVDGKHPEVARHFRMFPMVAFHPGDLDLVFGGPAVRRRFLDRMLFQAEPGYAQWHRDYHRALRARNALLRQGSDSRQVRAYDPLLARWGAKLSASRRRLAGRLASATAGILEQLTIDPFNVNLHSAVEGSEDGLAEALDRAWARDRERRHTTIGPHTDDVTISRPSGPARKVASRGEARAVAVSLRLAERQVVADEADTMPVLLLDDVWAELDRQRAKLVLDMVAEEPGQVVATGTGAIDETVVAGWRRFVVVGGALA